VLYILSKLAVKLHRHRWTQECCCDVPVLLLLLPPLLPLPLLPLPPLPAPLPPLPLPPPPLAPPPLPPPLPPLLAPLRPPLPPPLPPLPPPLLLPTPPPLLLRHIFCAKLAYQQEANVATDTTQIRVLRDCMDALVAGPSHTAAWLFGEH
jgi:hypothetical protein